MRNVSDADWRRRNSNKLQTASDRSSTRTVITYGTFDLFHVGHLRILERARALGDRLIVAVSTDEFNAIKGKASVIPFESRAEIVAGLACVDEVVPEERWDQKVADIQRWAVDTFVMGCDWQGKFDHLAEFCEVVYLGRTDGISSTLIKTAMGEKRSLASSVACVF